MAEHEHEHGHEVAAEEAPVLAPKSEVQEIGPCRLKLTIEVAEEKVRESIDRKYTELSDNVALPGFRRGHAPRKLLERKFGKEIVDNLRLELLNGSLEEVVEERKLDVIGEPELKIDEIVLKEEGPFRYETVVEVRPSFELKEYRNIPVKRPKVSVDEKEVEALLKAMHESKAEYVTAEDGTAKLHDQIVADFEFICDNQVLEKSENVQLFLNENIALHNIKLPAFHRAILGMKPGNTVEFSIDIPKEFREGKYADKTGWIRGKIKSVKRKHLPPLDDAWAKSMDAESLDSLKDELLKRMTHQKEEDAKLLMQDRVVDAIADTNNFPLPEGLVQRAAADAEQRLRVNLMVKGTSKEQIEKEVEKHRGESRDMVVKNLRVHFILDHLAQKERIFVTEDEVEDRIASMATHYGKWPHEMRQHLESNDLIGQLRRQMREEKIKVQLLEWAKVEDEEKKS